MKDELVSFSKTLISVPSVKDSPEKLQQVLDLARLQVADFPYKTFSQNGSPSLLIYNRWPDNGRFPVLLNAHLDVVPGKPEQFAAKVENGRLIGRGAIDMKAAAATEILAFKETAAKVSYPLALQLVTDEEIGGHLGVKHQIAQNILTDFYLCGEYSDLDISTDSKGVLWLKLITTGKRAHGAYVWSGVNAVTKLAKEILAVSRIFPVPVKPAWKTTCNFGVVAGGNTVNQVPDEASVTLDIRRVPADSSAAIREKIKSHLIYPDTKIAVLSDEPCNHADRKHPLIAKLVKVTRTQTGKPVKYVRFHGASDARHYSAVGTTAIDFGPTGEGLHSDYEWVDIQSLENFFIILKTFLLGL